MNEDELQLGIMDALTLSGWRWTHIRDSRGVTQGHSGLVDIIAVHPSREVLILWELKGEGGVVSRDQWAWLGPLHRIAVIVDDAIARSFGRSDPPTAVDVRVVTPADYDHALRFIVGKADRWPG